MNPSLRLPKDLIQFDAHYIRRSLVGDLFKQLRERGTKTPESRHRLKPRRADCLQRILNGEVYQRRGRGLPWNTLI